MQEVSFPAPLTEVFLWHDVQRYTSSKKVPEFIDRVCAILASYHATIRAQRRTFHTLVYLLEEAYFSAVEGETVEFSVAFGVETTLGIRFQVPRLPEGGIHPEFDRINRLRTTEEGKAYYSSKLGGVLGMPQMPMSFNLMPFRTGHPIRYAYTTDEQQRVFLQIEMRVNLELEDLPPASDSSQPNT